MNKYFIVFLAICLANTLAETPENVDYFKGVKEEISKMKEDVIFKFDDVFSNLKLKEKIGSSFDKLSESLDQITAEVNSASKEKMES